MKLKTLLYHPSLSFKENRVYKIFNIMLMMSVIVLFIIDAILLSLGAFTPFYIVIGEIIIVFALLFAHYRGHFITSRYIFFSFAITMQVYGSLFHGENGGYDFLFLITSFCPLLFFEKRSHYLSLFILSISTFILVKVLYNYVDPVLPFAERQIVPYYLNIVISALLIYFSFDLFKIEHLRHEVELIKKNNQINSQKEGLSNA